MMLRRKTDPKTGTHTLCEPAQSKCTWKSHKSHFIRKLTRKMPRPGLSPERGHTLCASLRSRNALHHFTRATLYRDLQEKCRAQDSAQNADAHFVRACAVEMHFNGSQEPIYSEIYRKNAAPKIELRTRTHTHSLREHAQTKCTSTFTRDFIRKFTRKMLRPRVSTLNKHRPLHLPQEPLSVDTLFGEIILKIFRKKYNAPKADPLKKTFQLKSAMPQSKAHQFLPCLNLLPCQHHERIFREDLKRAHMNKLKVFEAKIVQISAEIWFQFCIYTKIKIFHIQLI